ncbi:MAG: hypothetical protein AAF741_16750 [Bacteroidota bacterium]
MPVKLHVVVLTQERQYFLCLKIIKLIFPPEFIEDKGKKSPIHKIFLFILLRIVYTCGKINVDYFRHLVRPGMRAMGGALAGAFATPLFLTFCFELGPLPQLTLGSKETCLLETGLLSPAEQNIPYSPTNSFPATATPSPIGKTQKNGKTQIWGKGPGDEGDGRGIIWSVSSPSFSSFLL